MSIKEHRQAAGLTQQQFAELFDISIDTVKSWDCGRRKPDKLKEKLMMEGYKIRRGKNLPYCAPGQERATRGKQLGADYTEEGIRGSFAEKNSFFNIILDKVYNVHYNIINKTKGSRTVGKVEIMLRTLESREEIKIGMKLRFAELWDGDGDGQELLESGSVSPDNENVVAFEIVETDEDILNTLILVRDIY